MPGKEIINKIYIDKISELLFTASEDRARDLLKGTIIHRNLWIESLQNRSLEVEENKERNKLKNICYNFCEILSFSTDIPEEFCAYHTEPPNQKRLKCDLLDFEQFSCYNHLFFSFDLRYIVSNYLLPSGYENKSIHVIDVRKLRNAGIQINYSAEVLCGSKIRSLIEFYYDPHCIERYANYEKKYANCRDESTPSGLDYIKPFINKSKDKLRQAIIQEITEWPDRNTVLFRIEKLEEYKKNQNYLLIPSPVAVRENNGVEKKIPGIKVDEKTKVPKNSVTKRVIIKVMKVETIHIHQDHLFYV